MTWSHAKKIFENLIEAISRNSRKEWKQYVNQQFKAGGGQLFKFIVQVFPINNGWRVTRTNTHTTRRSVNLQNPRAASRKSVAANERA